MKNIFIIPTDQPSKLWINTITGKLVLDKEPNTLHSHHLYITSNEEIREGDWFLSDFNSFPLHNIKELSERKDSLGWKQEDLKNNLKIILTTDQTLIADGVQSIDNEFLEWFVQNPTCEYVEVKSYWKLLGNDYEHNGYATLFYEIISRYVKEEPKQEIPTYDESIQHILTAHKIPKELFGQEEPKQETLEEAAEKEYPIHNALQHSTEYKANIAEKRLAFIFGAEWQAKRMYSEEDIFTVANKVLAEEYSDFPANAWHYEREFRMLVKAMTLLKEN